MKITTEALKMFKTFDSAESYEAQLLCVSDELRPMLDFLFYG